VPVGLSMRFGTTPVTPPQGASSSSSISVAATSSTTPGTYLVTIVGISGPLSRTTVLTIVVTVAVTASVTTSTQTTSPSQTSLQTQTATQIVSGDIMDIIQRNSLLIIGLLAMLTILVGALAIRRPKTISPLAL
jgi:hypothetical protein